MMTLKEFKKLDIRMGKIVKAERVEGADKLLRLVVDLGDEKRQLVAGIAKHYKPSELAGALIPVLVNLEPAKFRGIESWGMILAADDSGKPVLLHPDKAVKVGSVVR